MRRFISGLMAVLVFVTAIPAYALPKAYWRMEPGLFSGPPHPVVNGQKLEPHFWSLGKFDVVEVMGDNPAALELARKHEKYANYAGIALWESVGASMVYTFSTSRDRFEEGIYWTVFGIGFITAAFLQHTSHYYLVKSINIYNGVPATSASNVEASAGVIAMRTGPGLGLSLSF